MTLSTSSTMSSINDKVINALNDLIGPGMKDKPKEISIEEEKEIEVL